MNETILNKALPHWQAESAWSERAKAEAAAWRSTVDRITQRRDLNLRGKENQKR